MAVSNATAELFDPLIHTDREGVLAGIPVSVRLRSGRDYERHRAARLCHPGQRGAHVVWQQQVVGVPVFNALFIGHMTATGELAAVACDFVPAPAKAVDPDEMYSVLFGYDLPVGSTQALQAAINNVGDVFAMADITNQSSVQDNARNQSFTAAKGIKGIAYAALTWFPASRNELKLAWQVIFTSQWRNEMYLALVSADDGQILYRRSLTADSSDASYRVYADPSPHADVAGLARAQPHPAAAGGSSAGHACGAGHQCLAQRLDQ